MEDNFLLIAGPCSAESQNQLQQTVIQLHRYVQPTYYRAGVWKPRTRPGNFEGLGEEALRWMQNLQKEFHIRFITEVATPHHIELCLQYDITAFWIGARTAVSPFSVQEIAESIKGCSIDVFLKNPINPDLNLWLGGIERLLKAEPQKVGAIHRGFSLSDNSGYRNNPKWEIAIEFKSIFPDIPLIVDPSHICGSTEKLTQVSQKAMELGFDGLMLEAHYNPAVALSDKEQQITPRQLKDLLDQINIRKNTAELSEIEILRSMIDEIDEELIRLIKKRLDVVEKIGAIKYQNNLSVFQMERWKEIIATRSQLARHLHIKENLIKEFIRLIHKHSIHAQSKLFDNQPHKK